jgi:hypothetical protein
MAFPSVQQLESIRDSAAEIHTAADQAWHVVEAVRLHLLPDGESGADSLLSVAADVIGRIHAHAEAVAGIELRLRCSGDKASAA